MSNLSVRIDKGEGEKACGVVSLFFVPMLYFLIYRAREKRMFNRANSNKKS